VTNLCRRLFTEHRPAGVARHQPTQYERYRDNAYQDRDRQDYAAKDKGTHTVLRSRQGKNDSFSPAHHNAFKKSEVSESQAYFLLLGVQESPKRAGHVAELRHAPGVERVSRIPLHDVR